MRELSRFRSPYAEWVRGISTEMLVMAAFLLVLALGAAVIAHLV